MWRPLLIFFVVLVPFLVAQREAEDDYDNKQLTRTERNTDSSPAPDTVYNRVLNIIQRKTEKGRLVLLLCKQLCPRQRKQIPQWIRKFNEKQNNSVYDSISYHYYLIRQDLPFMNGSTSLAELQSSSLVYLIGNEAYFYEGSVTNRDEVEAWLEEMDVPTIHEPVEYGELDTLLNQQNCTDRYLIYSTDEECELYQWKTISRLVHLKLGISTIHLRRPLSMELAAAFYRRLPQIGEDECRILTFLQLHTYTLTFTETKPAEVLDRITDLMTDDECIMMDDYRTQPLAPALSDLEMKFYSRERKLRLSEKDAVFVVVGSAAGIAVVALAISIFWGLNGT